ncbi:MAG: LytTR family DNA-binding domain-containing protein [Mobilitalea sp.]
MMLIGICDDEKMYRSLVIEQLDRYGTENNLPLEVLEFQSGEELMEQERELNLVLLDIEMQGISGMETAYRLQERNEDLLIIFLTGHKEMMQESFEVNAFRFLLKPLQYHDLERCMNAVRKELDKGKVILNLDGMQKVVLYKSILYIEADGKNTIVRTLDSSYLTRNTMIEWEEILNKMYFVRCHKTYFINLAYVDEVNKEYIILQNKERVAISRRNRKEFQQKLYTFISNRQN